MGTPTMDTMKQQSDDNLHCTHCHELLPSQANFCPRCGSPTVSEQQVLQASVFRAGGQAQQERILVFFSYADRDQSLRDQLENHLSTLKYRGLITTWHAKEISAGEEPIQQIDIHLNTAHIILLLISANFLASQYCYSREMLRALERHEHGEAQVIPVLLRPVIFTDLPFAKLQPLPSNGKPVTRWSDRDMAFVDIALGIERLVLKLRPPAYAFQGSVPRPPLSIDRSTSMTLDTDLARRAVPRRPRTWWLLLLCLAVLLGTGIVVSHSLGVFPSLGTMALFGLGALCLLVLLAGVIALFRTIARRQRTRKAVRQEDAWAQQWGEVRRQAETRRQEEARRYDALVYYESALSAYEAAFRQDSTDATALRGKGNALVGLSRYDEALTAFEQAVALAPHAATYVSMGTVLVKLGRDEEAVQAYEQALQLDTTYASAYTGLSEALSQLGRTQEAEQARASAKQLGEED